MLEYDSGLYHDGEPTYRINSEKIAKLENDLTPFVTAIGRPKRMPKYVSGGDEEGVVGEMGRVWLEDNSIFAASQFIDWVKPRELSRVKKYSKGK